MNDKFKYLIDTDHKIIFHTYFGDIGIKDMRELELVVPSDPNYQLSFDQIHDFRYCNLDIKTNELPNFISFLKNEVNVNGYRCEIYLTNKPNEVVITTLYKNLISEFKFKPFIISTLEMAVRILTKSNLNVETLDTILENLRDE